MNMTIRRHYGYAIIKVACSLINISGIYEKVYSILKYLWKNSIMYYYAMEFDFPSPVLTSNCWEVKMFKSNLLLPKDKAYFFFEEIKY